MLLLLEVLDFKKKNRLQKKFQKREKKDKKLLSIFQFIYSKFKWHFKIQNLPKKFKYLLIYIVIRTLQLSLSTKFNRNKMFLSHAIHFTRKTLLLLSQLSSGLLVLPYQKLSLLFFLFKNRKILTENDSCEGIQGCNYPRALQFQTKKIQHEKFRLKNDKFSENSIYSQFFFFSSGFLCHENDSLWFFFFLPLPPRIYQVRW